jgi:hypothetical protein
MLKSLFEFEFTCTVSDLINQVVIVFESLKFNSKIKTHFKKSLKITMLK